MYMGLDPSDALEVKKACHGLRLLWIAASAQDHFHLVEAFQRAFERKWPSRGYFRELSDQFDAELSPPHVRQRQD